MPKTIFFAPPPLRLPRRSSLDGQWPRPYPKESIRVGVSVLSLSHAEIGHNKRELKQSTHTRRVELHVPTMSTLPSSPPPAIRQTLRRWPRQFPACVIKSDRASKNVHINGRNDHFGASFWHLKTGAAHAQMRTPPPSSGALGLGAYLLMRHTSCV